MISFVYFDLDGVLIIDKKENINKNTPKPFSFSDFISKFEKNEHIQPVIKEIKKDCRIGLLTNMYPKTISAIMKRGIIPKEEWDVVVDSSIENCQKPNLEIFQQAEEKASAKKEEILFIDDKLKNIRTAEEFGWNTFFYDNSDHKKTCSDFLDYYKELRV